MKINPGLLTANSTNFLITVLNKGQGEPVKLTFITQALAHKGDTTLSVLIVIPSGYVGSDINIVNGTFFIADNQIITLDGTVLATASSITVDPLIADLPLNSTFTSYVGSVPVLGLESANLQLQKEVNQVVLLSSKGWSNKDYSTGSWQFSGNMMIPVSSTLALYGQKIVDALLTEKSIFCERVLSNGRYFAGRAIATDASDTTSGNQYVSINLTLQGSGKILQKIIDTPVPTTPINPIPPVLNPGYRVVILAGQSNAEGSGSPKDSTLDAGDPRMFMYAPGTGTYSNQLLPAVEHLPNSEGEIPYPDNITFATHFVKNYLVDHPADRVVILTCAQGNTGFSTNAWNPGNYLYTRAVNVANSFISGHADSNLLAILWHQGERDHDNGVPATDQRTNVLAMLDAMRTALNKSDLPFICGGLSPDWLPGDTLKNQYNTMYSNLNLDRSYVAYADSVGLSGGGSGNEIHFNAPSLRILGARYYDAYKIAKDYVLGTTPQATNLVATPVSSTLMRLDWAQTGVYQNFSIQYKLNSDSSWSTLAATSFLFGLVPGLSPNTTYNFRIRTNGASSSVAYSQIVTATTNSTLITYNDPKAWLTFWSGGYSNQNNNDWGWATPINIDDSVNIVADPRMADVIKLQANQGFIFYRQVPNEMTKMAWAKLETERSFAGLFGGEDGYIDGRKDVMVNNGSFQAWGNNYAYFGAADETIPNDEWVHLACSVSKATSTIKLYINGILRKTLIGITHNPDGSNGSQFVGLLTFGGGSWENYMDEAMIFDYVLTDNQVAHLYQVVYRY